jgi:serine/threonine protein kinase
MSSRRIGNYQIIDYIGGGGFGSVFKAEDVSTPGRVVAIKELHKKHTRNTVIKQRFFQEAVAMARLDHENLPRLFTFGEDNGCYYLVMEFISGRMLSDQIHDGGPMQPELATKIIAQVLEALSYAHRNGIIHRDLKPDNIILIDDNNSFKIKVLDFGIARMVGGENITLAGEGFGTPAYMSPERITGASGDDPRIDIYATGIILYEMLAGKAPYESRASDPLVYWSEMRELHESKPLPSLASLGVPAELERILKRATAKRVEDRYASADDMLAEIKSIMGEGVMAAPASLAPSGAKTARRALTTMPGGADVYIDDVPRGSSDLVRGKILIEELTPGLRSVRVTKSGYSEYKIQVSLEEDHQTDLQVALAARSTVAMPSAEATAAGGFGTLKLEDGDETQTALLVVESLPVGTTVFLGSDRVGQAGEDGRATIKLVPGAHEVRVAAPSGATSTRTVTVTAQDSGSLKKITIPIEEAAKTDPMPVVYKSEPSATKKRIAVGASVALLLALLAGAYFAFRGPARGSAQVDTTTQQAALAQPAQAEPAASPNDADAESKKVAGDQQKAQSDAEKARLEKKLAETEKKLNEEKKPAEGKSPAPGPAAPAVVVAPQPATPEPPRQADSQTGSNACVVVVIAAPEGMPLNRFRVSAVEQPDTAASIFYNGHLNQKGRWHTCGLTAGHKIKVDIFGPRGALLASKQSVISSGNNFIEFAAPDKLPDKSPGDAPAFDPARKRFRRPRP